VEISEYLEDFAAWLFMAGWWLHAMELDFVVQSLQAIDRNGERRGALLLKHPVSP